MSDAPQPAFWFRIPDIEDTLMMLRPAELKCYLVGARAIQRDRNKGRLSDRQIADRARVGLRHVGPAMTKVLSLGLLSGERRPGSISVYTLPVTFAKRGDCIPLGEQLTDANCIPTGEQLPQAPVPQGKQLGEQRCIPVGEQNCSPTGVQHLESSELKSQSQQHDDSATVRKNREQSAECAGRLPSPKDETRNGLNPAKAVAGTAHQIPAVLPPLEHLKRLRSEMAAIKGEQPSPQMLNDVCKVLEDGNRSILGFALHLANVDDRYRPGGHKAVRKWAWFISVAEAYCDTPEPELPGHYNPGLIDRDECVHGKADGQCVQCLPRAAQDRMTGTL